jgi:hypothetical protein
MPQVPYKPYPEGSPLVSGEHVDVSTTPSQFGANIGAAVEHLGTTFDKVGNEMWDRALGLQQLQNETDARAAAATYAESQAKMQADFDSKVGQDAVSSLSPHLAASRKLRDDTRATLGNPMAQKMYDGMTFGFLERNIFSSARHAGDAQKQNTIDGYAAAADVAKRRIYSDPDNEDAYKKSSADYVEAARKAEMIRKGVYDPNDPIIQNAGEKAQQSALATKIDGISKTRPIEAMKLLEDNKEKIGEDEYNRLEQGIETKGLSVASVNLTNDVLAAHVKPDGTYDLSEKDLQEEVRKKAEDQFPGWTKLPIAATRNLSYEMNSRMSAARRDNMQASADMDHWIAQHPEVRTPQEIMAAPDTQMMLNKMGKYNVDTLQHRIEAVRGREYSSEWEYNNHYLKGLAATNPSLFQSQDLDDTAKWNLKPTDRLDLKAAQVKSMDKPTTNPKVTGAMSLLWHDYGGQLNGMGVRRDDLNNPKSNYNHFLGTLQEALAEWPADHGGKPATPDDIRGPIWEQLRAGHAARFYGTDYHYLQWQMPAVGEVPAEYADKVTADVIKAGLPQPSQQQIWRAYRRELFQQIMKTGKTSVGPEEKPTTTAVP